LNGVSWPERGVRDLFRSDIEAFRRALAGRPPPTPAEEIAALQAELRDLRESGAPEEALLPRLQELFRMGGLQSWRDAQTLAEHYLAGGKKPRARKLLEEAIGRLRGQPGLGHARKTLEELLARAQSRPRRRPAPEQETAELLARSRPASRAPPASPVAVPDAAPAPAPAQLAAAPPADDVALSTRLTVVGDQPLAHALGALEDGGLARWRLALRAHQVAVTDRFDELLVLGRMRGVEQMAHQIETVKRALRALRGRALLADEVGLGKTIEAGMFLAECLHRALCESVLVLVPAALVGQWREELASKFGVETASSDDPACRARPPEFWPAQRRVVASLELCRRAPHADLVAGRPWDLVIVDEAHRLKRSGTQGHRLVDRLRSRFLLLLTATPVENNLEELYAVVSLLRPGQLSTRAEFRRRFVTAGDSTAPRDAEGLRALLAEVMIRNTRALVDVRLPPRFASTLRCAPSPAEAELYARLQEIVAARYGCSGERMALGTLLQEAGSSPRAVAATVTKMLARPGLDAALAVALQPLVELARGAPQPAKAQRLVELARASAAAGERSVVFTRYRETMAFLEETLESERLPHVRFSGEMSGPEKDAAVAALRERVPLMLCTEVGGEGRNLQCASTIVNYDLPWNPMRLEQRIGRLHRIGQTREVRIYNLCAAGSAEERILEVLDRRINLFELVVGELDMILGQLEDERGFAERVLEIYGTARSADDVGAGFTRLGDELAAARVRYERSQAAGRALFGRDFEV
jgi:superfamily II DNA or RNA helicase